ncbi:thiopurine S-methyltransferase [Stutzerimonas nitrititolerans]|uniref:thiopurine S-methyltransferase n=1 Tax=Stutzerimonas nitrititolerans TaxID=2482751 RepID=UPI0028B0456C|nr:thiopurine S-methyltransferase [Stutzerimonas nitrititolerans]
MHADFWQGRWARNDIGFHLDQVHPGLRRHWPRLKKLQEGATVLVPLCGKSLDLAWLAGEGFRVLGVELSQKAVETFFAEQQLEAEISQVGPFKVYRSGTLEIRCGDIFALGADDVSACQGVYDRAALIALPPLMRQRYAAHLSAILPAGCQQLLVTLDYEQAQMDGPPFAVGDAEVMALYAAEWQVERLEAKEVLATNPRMRERGLQRLEEHFHRLQRHA